MSLTKASVQYFDQVASQWDNLRSGYFTEEVRKNAFSKAYLRPEIVVGDVGWNGFYGSWVGSISSPGARSGRPTAMLAVA